MRKSQARPLTSKNGQHFNGASLMSPLESLIGKEKLTSIAAGFKLAGCDNTGKTKQFRC